MPVFLLLDIPDNKPGGGNSAARHLLETEVGPGTERLQPCRDGGGVRTGIGEGADHHVAGDARKRIDVTDSHWING